MPAAEGVTRMLRSVATLSIIPFLFYTFTLFSDPDTPTHSWGEGLQGVSAILILAAFVLVCFDRPRWGEYAVAIASSVCGIASDVYLWIHRERLSMPYAGYPLSLVIIHTVVTAAFCLAVLLIVVMALATKDESGLTGDGDITLPIGDGELNVTVRDVIGGRRTILYRWGGYIAAIGMTMSTVLLVRNPPWPPVRTPARLAGVTIAILTAFFIVIYISFAVMRGPWSTATQDGFYLRAKLGLVLCVLYIAGTAPFTFPRPKGYGHDPHPLEYLAWSLSLAGATGVLLMLGIIVRFERHRGVALGENGDGDEATVIE